MEPRLNYHTKVRARDFTPLDRQVLRQLESKPILDRISPGAVGVSSGSVAAFERGRDGSGATAVKRGRDVSGAVVARPLACGPVRARVAAPS